MSQGVNGRTGRERARAYLLEESPAAASCERSVVEDDVHERIVDAQPAIVLNGPEFPEFVHEEVHPFSGGANHLGQRFLTDLGNRHRFAFASADTREQQENARQALLARIEELIDQVLLDANIAG